MMHCIGGYKTFLKHEYSIEDILDDGHLIAGVTPLILFRK